MQSFINNILVEAGDLLNAKSDVKDFIKTKENKVEQYCNQIVTEQDLLIEDFLIHSIQNEFPDSNIISEEKKENDFSLIKPTWVIDPIDGSLNYFKGINFYCISLSYWENNEPKYAGVYSPFNGELFYAARNQGARLNGNIIRVTGVNTLDESLILLSGYNSFKLHMIEDKFCHLSSRIKNMRILSSSVLDMCYVAAGRCEGRIYSFCKFWDISAAKLILEEAGGKLTDWKGESTNLFSNFMVASNNCIHDKLIDLLK